MKAILSDIHGNLEALLAVLDDARSHGATAVYCLGDLIGFGGPDPVACVERAMTWPVVLPGGHDRAAFGEMAASPPPARRALLWAAAQLGAPVPTAGAATRRRAFLGGLPPLHREGAVLYVHGSPADPAGEFVFPEDTYNERKMRRVFAPVERYGFQGHTHVPGLICATPPGPQYQFLAPADFNDRYRLDDRKTLVNVGSVGQPRDGDWRACYVLFDGLTVTFRRVEFAADAMARRYDLRDGP